MSASLSGLSASVTRILSLTGFSKELKTKDIQAAFSEWENVNGGFKIKWKDDTSLLIVFQDAVVAKRAYLQAIAYPPPILTSSISAVIKPYDGPDAQSVIQSVNARGQHHSNPSRSHAPRAASISVMPNTHVRTPSAAMHNGSQPNYRLNTNTVSVPFSVNEREPSPTLPSLPSHPSLNSLINSSLGEVVARDAAGAPPSDPAILATSLHPDTLTSSGPRIGDPGKRMLGMALGMRLPSLGPRVLNGGSGSSPVSAPGQVDSTMGLE